MHSNIVIILSIFLLLISPTGAGTFISGSGSTLMIRNYSQTQQRLERDRLAKEKAEAEAKAAAEEADRKLHTYAGFERYDIEGYCIINVPSTHFILNETVSSKSKKQFTYTYSDISYIDIEYKTNVTEDDIEHPGTNLCGFKEEPTHEKIQCNDLEAIRIIEKSDSDNFSRVSWSIPKGKSVLLVNGYVAPNVDMIPFMEAVESALSKTSVYYISKTVFETPKTGHYATLELPEEPNPDNENNEGEENSENNEKDENMVGGDIPGTIATDKVTNDWKELKYILDGDTIYVPCKMSELLDYGYKLKDYDTVGDIVKARYTAKLVLYKDNGVVLTVTARNLTDSSLRLEALDIVKIVLNRDEFGYYSTNPTYTKDNLPELIATGGMTWGIKFDDLIEIVEDHSIKELVNGDFQVTAENFKNKKIVFVTKNFKDIRSITMEFTPDEDLNN